MTFLQTITTRKPLKRKDLSPGKGGVHPRGNHLGFALDPKARSAFLLDRLHPLRPTGAAWTWWVTGRTRSTGTARHVTASNDSHAAIIPLLCLKFGPLVGCEHVAD